MSTNISKSNRTEILNYNIANSSTWDEHHWFNFVNNRLTTMQSKRAVYEEKWKLNKENYESLSIITISEGLDLNLKIEKGIAELVRGRLGGKVEYDIMPDGQADIDELQASRYVLNHYLDGNDDQNFWEEWKRCIDYGCVYGSWILFTGIRNNRIRTYQIKENFEYQAEEELINGLDGNVDEVIHNNWLFFPKALHPLQVFIDDLGYGSNDFSVVRDFIYQEKISVSEFNLRFQNNPAYNQTTVNDVGTGLELSPITDNSNSQGLEEIVLYHYFNKDLRTYCIMANRTTQNKGTGVSGLLYRGKFLYDDDKLPIVIGQHYTNPFAVWGEGVCDRVSPLKLYLNEILKDILVGAEMSSGVNLLATNDTFIDNIVGGRGINLWRTNTGLERPSTIDTSIDVGKFTNIYSFFENIIAQLSGEDLRAAYAPRSDKLGIEELLENRSSLRVKPVDENYHLGLDRALTMCLSRIKQYAWKLEMQEEVDENGKKTISYPKILVRDKTIKYEKTQGKKKKKIVFVEDLGVYGQFELKEDTIAGKFVKVVTPNTKSMLPALERERNMQLMQMVQAVFTMAQTDPSGQWQQKALENFDFDTIIGVFKDAQGLDDKFKAQTKKDRVKEENKRKLDLLKQLVETPVEAGMGGGVEGADIGLTGTETTNPTQQGQTIPGELTPITDDGGEAMSGPTSELLTQE